MRAFLRAPLGVVALTLLAACDPAALATYTSQFKDLDGDGHITAAEQALQGFHQTFAGASGGPANINQAQQNGIDGFGVGTSTTTASPVTGTYLVGNVKADGSNMTVTLGSRSYTMPYVNDPSFSGTTVTIDGHAYSINQYSTGGVHTFTSGTGTCNPNCKLLEGNNGGTISGTYASLAYFIKNAAGALDGSGNLDITYDGYSLLAVGLSTPTSSLPSMLVTYNGEWFLVSGAGATSANSGQIGTGSGVFHADMNFITKTVTTKFNDFGDTTTLSSGTGKIVGNQFLTTMSGGYNGDLAGGIYGTHGEEIAGVGSGTTSGGDHAEVGFIATQH